MQSLWSSPVELANCKMSSNSLIDLPRRIIHIRTSLTCLSFHIFKTLMVNFHTRFEIFPLTVCVTSLYDCRPLSV